MVITMTKDGPQEQTQAPQYNEVGITSENPMLVPSLVAGGTLKPFKAPYYQMIPTSDTKWVVFLRRHHGLTERLGRSWGYSTVVEYLLA